MKKESLFSFLNLVIETSKENTPAAILAGTATVIFYTLSEAYNRIIK